MRLLRFYLFFAALVFSSLHGEGLESNGEHYTWELFDRFGDQMMQELKLKPSGSSGKFREKLEFADMSFNLAGRATVDEARLLGLYILEKFVNAINADERLRPYLIEYPFPPSRAYISIYFEGPSRDQWADGSVSHLFAGGYGLEYSTRNAFEDRSYHILEEEYAEAVEKVKLTPNLKPGEHQTTAVETAIDELFAKFTKEMADNHNLYVWGIGCKRSENLEEIDARFTFFTPVRIEEARAVILAAVIRLLELTDEQQHLPKLQPDQVNFRINFRNLRYTPYHDGTMESVTLEKGKLTYIRDSIWREGDPIEKLYEPPVVAGEETYQDAMYRLYNPFPNSDLLTS